MKFIFFINVYLEEKLLNAVQSFYVDSWACVRVGNDVSEWFPVNAGLRQGCVMSPWLFNVYMDGVVRVVNVRVLGKGLVLLRANGGRFEINQLLFADDTALVADSPPGGSEWIISVGDYVDNSFTALGSSDPREVRLEL